MIPNLGENFEPHVAILNSGPVTEYDRENINYIQYMPSKHN